MKRLLTAAAFIAGTICTTGLMAQPNAGAMPPPPPPDAGPGPGLRPAPPAAELQPLSNVNGKFIQLVANDDGVYDGFYMLSGQDSMLVKFPPHLGSKVKETAKSGAAVTVNGTVNTPPFGTKEMHMVSLNANGQTVDDTPPAQETTPPVENFVTGKGKVTGTKTDREGRVNGLILDNKTILHVPPHIANQLANAAKSNTEVAYTGMQKQPRSGEISTGSFNVVHCKTITLNGQQYLVQ